MKTQNGVDVVKSALSRSFNVCAGSIIGREHVRLRRNNQDAAAFFSDPEAIIAVVADGCSSARASEVGARLGSEWIAQNGKRLLKKLPNVKPEVFADAVVRGLLRYLGNVAGELTPAAIGDLFLFTLLVAVIDRDRAFVFGIGDGAFALNGQLIAQQHVAPPYIAYRLAGDRAVRPVIHWVGTTAQIQSLVLATDGIIDLDASSFESLIGDPAYDFNDTLLHKKLAALSEKTKKLFDDTTVVLIRRVPRNEVVR